MKKSRSRRHFMPIVFAISLMMGFPRGAHSQESSHQRQPGNKVAIGSQPQPSADLTEWRLLLDNLAVEARVLEPEQARPLIIAEVADAYWHLDRERSKKLLVDAFDRALTLPTTQKRGQIISNVLSIAAKRDRSLAVTLADRLLESRYTENSSAPEVLSVARELFESDRGLAVELAQAGASLGPSMSSLRFIFNLTDKDPLAAEQLYASYFKHLSTSRSPDLSSLLWLAGYPFGYGEAYSVSADRVSFTGFSGIRTHGLKPNPALARAYLQLALASVTDTLRKAAAANDLEREAHNGLAFFATAYLYPEVRNYFPNAEGAWSSLYRQALTSVSSERRAEIEKRLQSILEARSRATKYQSTDDFLSGDAKERLELINKLPDGCKRDQAYAEVALNFVNSKKFVQARETMELIGSISLRDSVLQFINYDVAAAAIDAGNVVEAPALAEKVAAKNQRALLFVKIAANSVKSGNKSSALDLLNRARLLVRESDDPGLQAGVLLAVASIYVQLEPLEASAVVRDAIKVINHVADPETGAFSLLRRVDLSCGGGEDRWHGTRERAETFSLYETLASIAVSDIQGQGALALASDLENKATRIRAQLSIVKAVTKAK